MESRNVKVIDEHGIDRNADVICGLELNEKNYVLYSIERDGDNDNLFISKIIKNIDGTSNMVNIEDSMEKNKANNVAKELITYSIKNEADKTTGAVTLSDGENVKIFSVLFNKEQNINVSKTYITTVKKSVTKVSENFYKVEEVKKEEAESSPIFESVSEEVFAKTTEEPTLVEAITEPTTLKPEVAPVEEMPTVEAPVEVVPEESVLPAVEEVKLGEVTSEPTVAPEEIKPVTPVIPVTSAIPEVKPEPVETSSVLPAEPVKIETAEDVKSEELVSALDASVEEIKKEEKVELTPISVDPVLSAIPETKPEPAQTAPVLPVETVKAETTVEPKLFFDGSKETNLNMALGDVGEEKTVPTKEEGLESLREFGVDEPKTVPAAPAPVQEEVKTLTRSKGFANNKFFMVIAIAFFVAACVFLGYEAFQYFQIKG